MPNKIYPCQETPISETPFSLRSLGVSVALLLLFLIFATPGWSTIYIVDTTLDSSAPGYRGCQTFGPLLPDCSLRGALLEANANVGQDTIVLSAGSTYTLTLGGSGEDLAVTGDLDITDDLILAGGQAVIDAAGLDRVLHVLAGLTELRGVTVRGGLTSGKGGGVLVEGGDLKLRNATVSNNEAGSHGGGVHFDGGSLDIADSALESNVSTANINGDGGGLYIAGGIATISTTLFDSNRADYGGAYFGRGGAIAITGGSLNISSSTLSNNQSGYHGGGVYSTASLVLSGVLVEANQATFRGGGLALFGGTADLVGVDVEENSGDWGGGIYSEAVVTLQDSTVLRNTAITGGGVYQRSDVNILSSMILTGTDIGENVGTGGTGGLHSAGGFGFVKLKDCEVYQNEGLGSIGGGGVTNFGDASGVPTMEIRLSTISMNSTTASGGGLNNSDGIMKVYGTEVWGNSADNNGGAVYSSGGFNGGRLVFNRSTARGNVASRRGGGIYAFGGGIGLVAESIVVLNNSTLSGNTSVKRGGAIAVKEGEGNVPPRPVVVTLFNVTIASNLSLSGPGGALAVSEGSVELYNSIVQSGQVDCATMSGGQIVSGHHNIESGTSCGFATPFDQQNTNALLDPLSNNGGATQTRALQNGSPAIDAGYPPGCEADRDGEWGIDVDPLSGDQRSVPRDNACDVGAYED